MAAALTPESLQCELLAEAIRLHGRARLRVQGTSMLPSLWPGDVLRVERRGSAEVGVGCIVLYRREQRVFAHRVVKKDPGLVTRGDRLAHPDPPLRPEELLGEVTWVERGGNGFAPARRAGWAAALLRLVSRVSDLPAGLLLRFGSARDAARLPELVPDLDGPR